MQAEILGAFDDLYDALVAPERWPKALDGLSRSLSAAGCVLLPLEPAGRYFHQVPSTELTEVFATFIAEGWHDRDPRLGRARQQINAGRVVVTEHDLFSEEERSRSPAHQEFYRRFDLPWWASLSFTVHGERWVCPVLRSGKQGPVTQAEASSWEALAPELARLVRTADLFAKAQGHKSLELLDALAAPALLIDWSGRVTAANDEAQSLFGPHLSVRAGKLVAADRLSQAELQDFLDHVTFYGRAPAGSTPVVIRRQVGPPLIVDAAPSTRGFTDVLRGCGTLIFLHDVAKRHQVPENLVMRAFDMTRAEARLAIRVANGESLAHAAAETGVRESTLRAQLKAIFRKTDTNRQTQLIALLARFWRPQKS